MSLFSLWERSQKKLPREYFSQQLLRTGELLFEAGFYSLSRVCGYRKCLEVAGLIGGEEAESSSEALKKYVLAEENGEEMNLMLVR